MGRRREPARPNALPSQDRDASVSITARHSRLRVAASFNLHFGRLFSFVFIRKFLNIRLLYYSINALAFRWNLSRTLSFLSSAVGMKSGYSPIKATHAKSPRGIRPKAWILLPRQCGEIRSGPLGENGNSRT